MKVLSTAVLGAALTILGAAYSASAATITVKNNCSYQIALGVYPAATYANGGAFLAAGASVSFGSFPVGNGGRVWSRDNCVANGTGPDTCSSGQCGGTGIQCAGSTAAGVSEAEINFDASGTDFYDVSYVDGLNNTATIATSSGVSYGCSSKPACTTVTNNGYGAAGDSCQSPCTAAQENIAPFNSNTPLYCCTGADGTSATCPLSSWTSSAAAYVNNIHSDCPGEYSYAYDDNVGLHTVATGVNYTITFCGGAGNTSSTSSTSSSSSSSSAASSTSTTSTSGGVNGTWQLTPQCATGSRLDVAGNGTANGTAVNIYQSNGTTAQQYSFSNSGVVPAGDYNFTKVGGSFCVQPTGTTSGSKLEIWSCAGSSAQAWNVVADSSPSGYYQLHPSASGTLCMDVSGAGTANNTAVEIYTCNSTNAQQWTGL
jgi:hypothetical protein